MQPGQDADLVVVRTFTTDSEAKIAKGALEAFGIRCMIIADDCGGQRPHLAFSEGLRLVVRRADHGRALDVLADEVY